MSAAQKSRVFNNADSGLPDRIKISDDVIFQEISGENVLLNMASEKYYGLDAVGTQIWNLFAQSIEPEKIVLQLKSEYGVEEKTLRRDLIALITDLKNENLIVAE